MFCNNCGNEYEGLGKLCPTCLQKKSKTKKPYVKFIIIGACFFVALIICIIILFFIKKNQPKIVGTWEITKFAGEEGDYYPVSVIGYSGTMTITKDRFDFVFDGVKDYGVWEFYESDKLGDWYLLRGLVFNYLVLLPQDNQDTIFYDMTTETGSVYFLLERQ